MTTSIIFMLSTTVTIASWETNIITLQATLLLLTTLYTNTTHLPTLCPYSLLDTISLPLSMLTMWTTSLMLISSMKIKTRNMSPHKFNISIMILALILFLAFNSPSLMTFYFLFESALIPTLFLILVWGYQPERLQAGMYLMLYTITASLPLFLTITTLFLHYNTTLMFLSTPFPPTKILAMTLTLAFLVKMPIYLLHLWLPKAHVEAPVAGSMILASVLLKLGSYGLLRISHMIPTSMMFKPQMIPTTLTGALITAILCLRQHDLKELVAYASVSHMSLTTAVIYTQTHWAVSSTMMMNVSHGLTSSLLFSLTNMYYENTHTRSTYMTKGMLSLHPHMALWWFLGMIANGGAPPFLTLLSEMLMIIPMSSFSLPLICLIAPLAFFSMTYSIFLYMTIHHGKPNSYLKYSHMPDHFSLVCLLHMAPLLTLMLASPSLTL